MVKKINPELYQGYLPPEILNTTARIPGNSFERGMEYRNSRREFQDKINSVILNLQQALLDTEDARLSELIPTMNRLSDDLCRPTPISAYFDMLKKTGQFTSKPISKREKRLNQTQQIHEDNQKFLETLEEVKVEFPEYSMGQAILITLSRL